MNRVAIQKNAVPDFGLQQCADQVLKRDNEGNTELMWMTGNAPVGWMAQYVQLKGNESGINAQNWKGHTALYIATSLGAKDKVEFLLRSGAADYPTVEGVTALHVAAAMNHEEIAKLLVQHGSFINAQGTTHSPIYSLTPPPRAATVVQKQRKLHTLVNVR
jgi:ankyrin repeat protein